MAYTKLSRLSSHILPRPPFHRYWNWCSVWIINIYQNSISIIHNHPKAVVLSGRVPFPRPCPRNVRSVEVTWPARPSDWLRFCWHNACNLVAVDPAENFWVEQNLESPQEWWIMIQCLQSIVVWIIWLSCVITISRERRQLIILIPSWIGFWNHYVGDNWSP